MREAVDDGAGENGVLEEGRPILEGEVGGDDDAALAVAVGQKVEEQLTSGLVEGDVAQLVEDNEAVAFKFSAVGAHLILAHGLFELDNEVRDGGEQDTFPFHAGGDAQSGGVVCLTGAGRADEDDVFPVIDESEGLQFLKFGGEGLVVFSSVEIHQVLLDGEPGVLNAAGDAVLGTSFGFTQQQALQEIGIILLGLASLGDEGIGVVADVGELELGRKFLYVRH